MSLTLTFCVTYSGTNVINSGLGLIAAICTAKIMSLINKNTKAILHAIADLHQK